MQIDKKGYSAIVTVFLVSTIGLILAGNISALMIARQKIMRNVLGSAQSYYTAEAGIEDALLRVIDPDIPEQNNIALSLAGSTASTTIAQDGNNITISSSGDKNDFVRNLQLSLSAATDGSSFNYGVQIGSGGLEMKNSGRIEGNVYSDGDIIGTNSPVITGDAWASGVHTIQGFRVDGDAHAHTLKNDSIGGDAYYVTKTGTTVSGTNHPGSADPPAQTMPINDTLINSWKDDAVAGGTYTGDYLINTDTVLGPTKIVGNLTIESDAVVTMEGTIWVTGNIILQNNGVIQLASGYGINSGVIIADGSITLQNNFILCGSEGYVIGSNPRVCNTSNGSYVLLMSNKVGDGAVSMKNNAKISGILYAPYGDLEIENNAFLKEATAYKIEIENNVVVRYETGLINVNFSSGPGGGWTIGQWQETQ